MLDGILAGLLMYFSQQCDEWFLVLLQNVSRVDEVVNFVTVSDSRDRNVKSWGNGADTIPEERVWALLALFRGGAAVRPQTCNHLAISCKVWKVAFV